MRTNLLSLIPIILLLSACGDKPSDGEITDLLNESLVEQGLDEFFSYTGCDKTNGFEENGYYVVTMDCTVKFKKGYDDIPMTSSAGMKAGILSGVEPGIEAGDKKSTTAKVRLRKSEQGWILASE